MTDPDQVLTMPSPGTRVLVTGATGGLAGTLVELLVQARCRVAGVDLPAATEGRAFAGERLVGADLADPVAASGAVREAVDALGGLDAVVAAAGVVDTVHRAATFPVERWQRDLDGNLSGQFYTVQAAYPALRRSADPRVVLVSSIAAVDGLPGQAAYAAAKGGILGLTRSLAAEWAGDGIRVNAVVPGFIRTAKVDAIPTETADRLRSGIALGRFGERTEFCGLVLFLLSPGGGYCHGDAIRVDGGMSLNRHGVFR